MQWRPAPPDTATRTSTAPISQRPSAASATSWERAPADELRQRGRIGFATMSEAPPFTLMPLAGGRYELRAFSDESPDVIVLQLDRQDGRRLGVALADMLTALDAPDGPLLPIRLVIAGRAVTITGTDDRGLRLTIDR
jgi:hypothetical protein